MAVRRAELLVGAAGAVLGAGSTVLSDHGAGPAVAMAAVRASLGAARRLPLTACLVGSVALLVAAAAGKLPFPAYLLVAMLAFCEGRWGSAWAGGVLALLGVSGVGALVGDKDFVPYVLFLGTALGAGRVLGDRERVAAQLDQRARELDEEREAHASLSVRFERTRIAAELHDIVAHAISVMVVQAIAGQRLAAVDAQQTSATFASIAGAAHRAEQEVGQLVELLADEDAAGPVPDIALVAELVARAKASGLEVTLRLEGELEQVSADTAQIAFRIVQEGLTNALRYASGAPIAPIVRGEAPGLAVTVTNGAAPRAPDLADAGTGNGLHGLRERVSAHRGTFQAGATPEGGWRVSARLPVDGARCRGG